MASRTDENWGVHGVARNQRIEGFLRCAGAGDDREFASVVIAINLQRDENLLQIFLTTNHLRPRLTTGGGTPIEARKKQNKSEDDQHLKERKAGSWAGGKSHPSAPNLRRALHSKFILH